MIPNIVMTPSALRTRVMPSDDIIMTDALLASDLQPEPEHWRANDTSQPPHLGGAGCDPPPVCGCRAETREQQLTVSASLSSGDSDHSPAGARSGSGPLSGN